MRIPKITDPLGKYWEQPESENFIFQEDRVLVKEQDFERLKEYSTTIPSGKYIGKMWKRKVFDKLGEYWLLCWYGPNKNPDLLSINTLKIKVTW